MIAETFHGASYGGLLEYKARSAEDIVIKGMSDLAVIDVFSLLIHPNQDVWFVLLDYMQFT